MSALSKVVEESVKSCYEVVYAGYSTKYDCGDITKAKCSQMLLNNVFLHHFGRHERRACWLDINKLDINNFITIGFDGGFKDIHFLPNIDVGMFNKHLISFLSRLLTKKEKEKKKINLLNNVYYPVTYMSLASRLSCYYYKNDKMRTKDDINTVLKWFKSRHYVLSLFGPLLGVNLAPFLFTFMAADYVESLEVHTPLEKIEFFGQLIENMEYGDIPFKHLYYHGELTSKFKDFLNRLDSSNTLEGLSLRRPCLSKNDFEELCKLNLKSLSLQDVLGTEIDEVLYSKFFDSRASECLQMLNLDHNVDINLNFLTGNLGKLSSISLAYCGVEIKEILDMLSHSSLRSLKLLNLSGNKNFVPIGKLSDMLVNLQVLFIESVEWGDKCLNSFLRAVTDMNFTYGLCLNISNNYLTPSEYKDTFSDINGSPKVVELIWNNNPITEQFLSFLNKCRYLRGIFVDNSFNNCGSMFSLFSSIISKMYSIETISLCVDESEDIDVDFFLDKVLSCRNLRNLNITGFKMGTESFDRLANVIKSANVECLAINRCCSDPDIILHFLESITNINRKLSIDYRFFDIISSKKDEKLKDKAVRIENICTLLQNGGNLNDIMPRDIFSEPFVPLPFPKIDVFPLYVDRWVQSIFDNNTPVAYYRCYSQNDHSGHETEEVLFIQETDSLSGIERSGRQVNISKNTTDINNLIAIDSSKSVVKGHSADGSCHPDSDDEDNTSEFELSSPAGFMHKHDINHNGISKVELKGVGRQDEPVKNSIGNDFFLEDSSYSTSSTEVKAKAQSHFSNNVTRARNDTASSFESRKFQNSTEIRNFMKDFSTRDFEDEKLMYSDTKDSDKTMTKDTTSDFILRKKDDDSKSNTTNKDSVKVSLSDLIMEINEGQQPSAKKLKTNEEKTGESSEGSKLRKRSYLSLPRRPDWDLDHDPGDEINDEVLLFNLKRTYSLRNLCTYISNS